MLHAPKSWSKHFFSVVFQPFLFISKLFHVARTQKLVKIHNNLVPEYEILGDDLDDFDTSVDWYFLDLIFFQNSEFVHYSFAVKYA